jgi:hypothetical protein
VTEQLNHWLWLSTRNETGHPVTNIIVFYWTKSVEWLIFDLCTGPNWSGNWDRLDQKQIQITHPATNINCFWWTHVIVLFRLPRDTGSRWVSSYIFPSGNGEFQVRNVVLLACPVTGRVQKPSNSEANYCLTDVYSDLPSVTSTNPCPPSREVFPELFYYYYYSALLRMNYDCRSRAICGCTSELSHQLALRRTCLWDTWEIFESVESLRQRGV